MAWPAGMPLVTITQDVHKLPDGSLPSSYAVHLQLSVPALVFDGQTTLIRRSITLTAEAGSGVISEQVPHLNHPDLSPTPVYYMVTEFADGNRVRDPWQLTPAADDVTIDLDAAAPIAGDPGTPVAVGPSGTLSDVSDGALTSPQTGDAPVFNEATGKWEKVSLSSTYSPTPSPTPPLLPTTGQLWYSSAFAHVRAPLSLAQRRVVFSQTGWEGAFIQEPSVWITGGTIKALFTAGTGLGFASCPETSDPTNPASWARPGTYTGPVVTGAKHASIYIEGATIHLYYIDQATSAKVWHATASLADAVPTFGAAVEMMALPAGSNAFGNTYVVKDASVYRMLVEHKITASGRWQMGWASAAAADGPWTLDVNTLETLWPESNRQGSGGAWLTQENDQWTLWYHSSNNWNGLLPSDIFRATTPTLGLDNFTVTDNAQPTIRRKAAHEVDQVADVELIRTTDGSVYGFWTGAHNRGANYTGAISCARMLPTMMRWDGQRWAPLDGPEDPGYAITDVGKPRTSMVTADFSSAAADGVTWTSITGLSVTHRATGPDVEVEFRTACAASGSAGYKYQFRVTRGGSDPKFLGSMAGNAGNMSSFVGVAKYTQLTPGAQYGFTVQVLVPTSGGTWNCRPVTFPEREYGCIKTTDIAYP